MIIYFPHKGFHKGFAASTQPPNTTPDCNNVRPLAGGRFQGGQRPGLEKTFDELVGGATTPVVAICEVTVAD